MRTNGGLGTEIGKNKKKISTKGIHEEHEGTKKDIHEGPRRFTKGHEGVGGASRGVRQGPRKGSRKALGYPLRGKKRCLRRKSKGLEKTRKRSVKGHEEKPNGK